jgi:hypothetical protein
MDELDRLINEEPPELEDLPNYESCAKAVSVMRSLKSDWKDTNKLLIFIGWKSRSKRRQAQRLNREKRRRIYLKETGRMDNY